MGVIQRTPSPSPLPSPHEGESEESEEKGSSSAEEESSSSSKEVEVEVKETPSPTPPTEEPPALIEVSPPTPTVVPNMHYGDIWHPFDLDAGQPVGHKTGHKVAIAFAGAAVVGFFVYLFVRDCWDKARSGELREELGAVGGCVRLFGRMFKPSSWRRGGERGRGFGGKGPKKAAARMNRNGKEKNEAVASSSSGSNSDSNGNSTYTDTPAGSPNTTDCALRGGQRQTDPWDQDPEAPPTESLDALVEAVFTSYEAGHPPASEQVEGGAAGNTNTTASLEDRLSGLTLRHDVPGQRASQPVDNTNRYSNASWVTAPVTPPSHDAAPNANANVRTATSVQNSLTGNDIINNNNNNNNNRMRLRSQVPSRTRPVSASYLPMYGQVTTTASGNGPLETQAATPPSSHLTPFPRSPPARSGADSARHARSWSQSRDPVNPYLDLLPEGGSPFAQPSLLPNRPVSRDARPATARTGDAGGVSSRLGYYSN